MTITKAYVVENKTSTFDLKDIPLKELGPNDVKIKMICSGLCHTDIHMQKNDWGVTTYPLVAGHEGVGRIVSIGSAVKTRTIGQKVGVGWISDSCEKCLNCIKGEENICINGNTGTIIGDNSMGGTFSQDMVVSARFTYPIPEEIPSVLAAPLLCAGITVYSPLRKWVQPNMKVGVISIGGLGHLAVQFARTLGAEVTAFSTSARKKEDAIKFGAADFVVFTNEAEMKAHKGTMDVILNTCPYTIPLDGFLETLAPNGTFVYIGVPATEGKELKVNLYELVFNQKTLAGSIVGGSLYLEEMFKMVKKFGIRSSVNSVDFSAINETCDRLLKGDLGDAYRFALCWDNKEELSKEMSSFLANIAD